MTLGALAIRRPVLAASLSLVILLFGLLSFFRIGVDRLPEVEFPVLTVITGLPGASPLTVAQNVTQPLETRLNNVPGLKTLVSTSTSGQSVMVLTFNNDVVMAEALNDVQSRLGQARRELPAEAESSVIQRFDLNAQPVMWLALSGSRSPVELSQWALQIQRQLSTVPGVGEVRLRGEQAEVLVITLSDAALQRLNLTYADVQQAFARQHLNPAGGRLNTEGRQYLLELNFEFQSLDALRQMPVASRNGQLIRLEDVAQVQEQAALNQSFARYQGDSAIALGVVRANGVNPVEVVNAVNSRLERDIRPTLPADLTLSVVSDDARPIQALVDALKAHLWEGTLLTALVTWLFLKSWRATGIIATAIPVSLMGAIAALYGFGYTFNSFTLLALLLLIGVVVDDAIVVLESIYRKQEEHPGLTREQAALQGTSEVVFAVMAATLTLVCVFAPVIFLPGVLGQFFQSFAVTVVAGVLVSWLVAMTLTPMLCARFLRTESQTGALASWLESRFRALEQGYLKALDNALRWPKTVLALALLSLLPAGYLFMAVDKEFSPQIDEGRITVTLSLPAGLSQADVSERALRAQQLLASRPEVASVLTTFQDGGRSGTDAISLGINLLPENRPPVTELVADLEQLFGQEPGWRATARAGSGGEGGGGAPLQFYLVGPDPVQLQELAAELQQRWNALPGLSGLRNNASTGLPLLSVSLNREVAARLGVAPGEVAQALSVLTEQSVLGRYTADSGERQDILLRADLGVGPGSWDALREVSIRSLSGELVPLQALLTLEPTGGAAALQRVGQQYAVTFSGSPRISLGEAIAQVQSEPLPRGYAFQFSGQAEEFRNLGKDLGLMLLLSVLLLYLVLASQFNHYGQPFLVMLAQPLALIGGVGALALTGQSLNIYSAIGLMLLIGLVTKSAILLIDRANQLREGGLPTAEALRQACPQRLRPVLMTSLTLILAMLPAALGAGAGSENNQPLATAIIGGMVSSTVLTLFVVPAAYAWFVRDAQTLVREQVRS